MLISSLAYAPNPAPRCTRQAREEILIQIDRVAVEREAQGMCRRVGTAVTLVAAGSMWWALGPVAGLIGGAATAGAFAWMHHVCEKAEEQALNEAHRLNRQHGCFRDLRL